MTRNEEIARSELSQIGDVLPELDQQIETKSDEYRFGFSFPWRFVNGRLQDSIIDYERALRGDPWFKDCLYDLFIDLQDIFKNSISTIGVIIAKEIAERYGLNY